MAEVQPGKGLFWGMPGLFLVLQTPVDQRHDQSALS